MNERAQSGESKPAAGSNQTPRKSCWRWLWRTFVALVTVWLLADLGHSLWMARRVSQWESSLQWDENGVMVGGQAYSLGHGSTAILMIHGLNENPYAWPKMAPWFAAHGYHCRVMRLPGFGEATQRYGSHAVSDWKGEVTGEIAKLREAHQRVVVVAHSMGCAVLINVLLEAPRAVDGVALLAPAIEVSNRRSPFAMTRFWHRLGCLLIFTRTVASPFDNGAEDPSERTAGLRNVFTPRRVIDQVFWLVDANRGRAAETEIPLFVAVAGDDSVIDTPAAIAFFHAAGSQRKQLVSNDRAGHVLPYDFGWDDLASQIDMFFRNDPGADGG